MSIEVSRYQAKRSRSVLPSNFYNPSGSSQKIFKQRFDRVPPDGILGDLGPLSSAPPSIWISLADERARVLQVTSTQRYLHGIPQLSTLMQRRQSPVGILHTSYSSFSVDKEQLSDVIRSLNELAGRHLWCKKPNTLIPTAQWCSPLLTWRNVEKVLSESLRR